MAAINQRIPNFLGGVSQQPDTIKFPGQLRVCDNALPDVTFGLTKRPPGEFVKKLDNVTSGDVSVIYQGDVVLGRMAMGADYLNPAACVELFAGTATKPAAF